MMAGMGRRLAAGVMAGLLLGWVGCVHAQIFDRIEVLRVGQQAEVHLRFASQIQYLRHAPPNHGRLLRIFLRLVNPPVPENDLMQETFTSPRTDLVPPFTVTFPELQNGLLVTFSESTRWDVRAGRDERSIVLTLPLAPGAKDVVAEARAGQEPAPAPDLAKMGEPAPAAATPAAAAPPAIPAIAAAPAAVAPPSPAAPSAPLAGPTLPPQPAAVTPAPAPTLQPPAPAPTPVPPAAPAAEEAPAPPALTAEQVEAMAGRFHDEARQALAEKDLGKALNRLNRVLGLPTNRQTEPAQALIGEVRELNGEILKARAEYELYLKLFPKGADAPRIRERLAALPTTVAPRRPVVPAQAGPAEWTFFGSLSQYLYRGKSHIEVTTPPPPGQLNFTTDTLSLTDQNALISTLDINARRRDGVTDTRIVVRDTNTQNYLNRQKSVNRLYSAYIEQSDRNLGYLVRAGRQNPVGGGVLERFDGIQAGYSLNERWRVNGVAGVPVEFNSPYRKDFYGVSVDLLPQADRPGVSAYYIQQHLEGVTNRQAVGLESRYFDPHASIYGMVDYDLAFKGLNIAMVQANYRTDGGTNYFSYLDHRKTPPFGLTNAVPGLPGFSLKEGLDTLGLNQVRETARALTATSDMFAIGLTYPYSPRWLLGVDYRAAEISGTEATGTMPALPGSGLNHVVSVQAIGNNLWTKNDVGVLNGSLIFGADYTGQALGGNYVFLYGDNWRLDGNLRYYGQRNDRSEKQVRLSPSLKASYRWKQVTLEAEFGAEGVRIDGPDRNERSNRKYFFVGYRADMR